MIESEAIGLKMVVNSKGKWLNRESGGGLLESTRRVSFPCFRVYEWMIITKSNQQFGFLVRSKLKNDFIIGCWEFKVVAHFTKLKSWINIDQFDSLQFFGSVKTFFFNHLRNFKITLKG